MNATNISAESSIDVFCSSSSILILFKPVYIEKTIALQNTTQGDRARGGEGGEEKEVLPLKRHACLISYLVNVGRRRTTCTSLDIARYLKKMQKVRHDR